jgi:hypothetical protein
MKSLKRVASEELKLSLDFSLGDRIRLKSPRIATEPERERHRSAQERKGRRV